MNQDLGKMKQFEELQSLLDADLADLADLADFKVPPVGRYTLGLSVETKEIGGHPAVIFNYDVQSIIEQVDPDAPAATIGDKFCENFNIDNEFGLGKLKKSLKPYAAFFSTTNIGTLLSMLDGIVIDGTVKRREDAAKLDDDGKPRVYGSVVNVTVQ